MLPFTFTVLFSASKNICNNKITGDDVSVLLISIIANGRQHSRSAQVNDVIRPAHTCLQYGTINVAPGAFGTPENA